MTSCTGQTMRTILRKAALPALLIMAGLALPAAASSEQESTKGARLLPSSSAMPTGDWRLPPPGYLDYCLRFRSRDRACRS